MSGAEHRDPAPAEPGSRWVLADAGEAPAPQAALWP